MDLTKNGSVERPIIDLMCLDVLKTWTDGSELQDVAGVTVQKLITGAAMIQWTYAEVLADGIVRMQHRLHDFERTVDSFSKSMKDLEKQLSNARWQRKVHAENVKTCRTRLERLKSDPSGKESLEYLASIQRKLLSQIMIIDEEEGTD